MFDLRRLRRHLARTCGVALIALALLELAPASAETGASKTRPAWSCESDTSRIDWKE